MNGKFSILSIQFPFVLSVSKDYERVFQQQANESISQPMTLLFALLLFSAIELLNLTSSHAAESLPKRAVDWEALIKAAASEGQVSPLTSSDSPLPSCPTPQQATPPGT